jgi:hypothetical protein
VGHSEKKLGMTELIYDWKSQRFVANKPFGIMSPTPEKKYSVRINTDIAKPMCNAKLGSYVNEEILKDSWKVIEHITALYPGTGISGGIFLYPRQAILISYLIQQEIASKVPANIQSSNLKPFTICETGYGEYS